MNDLRRWSNGDPSRLESQLLDAARGDHIPAVLRERMASALSASLAGTAASSAGAAGVWFSKAGLWGALALLVIAAPAFRALRSSEPPVVQRSNAPIAAPVHAMAPAAGAPEPAPRASEPLAPSAPELSPSYLRAEVALLDQARRALRGGAHTRAQALLAKHERAFSSGVLMPEAEALRIETLLERGERDGAAERYRLFKKRYSAHPLGERLDRLFEPAAPPHSAPESRVGQRVENPRPPG